MDPEERNPAYLWDMRDSAQLVADFLRGETYAGFLNNKMLQSAVERQLEIIGEAARRVTPQFQQDHREIPWHSIIGLRNILAHEYGDVQVDRIWLIATTSIPQLVELLESLIPPFEGY